MNKIYYFLLLASFHLGLSAQSVDKIEAVIGDEIILTSEIESQYLQYLSQGNIQSNEIKCQIIEDLLFQKLMINQARIDSLVVSDEEIEAEIDKRLSYFESQLGSAKKVEDYFGKSIDKIELELTKVIEDQFLAQRMQAQLTSAIKVTPAEVKEVYSLLADAEIPTMPTQVEVAQIVIKSEITTEQKDKIRSKLNSFRDRVYNGEDFKMLATLYSDDPGSATNGGELGFVNRGDLVPEFERAAFRLKEGEISEVVESQFGYHIVQLIERRGEQINVRHILIKAKVNATALYAAKQKMDNIAKEINDGIITFDDAVTKYSDDENKANGGLLLNPNTMSTLHTLDDMAPALRLIVDQLSEGDISSPAVIQMQDEKKAYRILRLNKRKEEHKANLVDDFAKIKEYSINSKQQEVLEKWVNKTIARTYIRLSDSLEECNLANKWSK
ncbi:MAG: peptidylprolyl isomerase [Flavobacteriales bacterium]|jgi:peptidyl-prolyl cis-trans isomerase SurA|nr:peptidylprolyl isomerase [Flavobacteriales bacterium]MDG1349026.1 peptidylprolyl isomerase [Flavobacteriales bacterium]|tara:strand:+ start:19799 stop:21124 length:1326 start_codon:yes stop_codon:yes gene_type:complete